MTRPHRKKVWGFEESDISSRSGPDVSGCVLDVTRTFVVYHGDSYEVEIEGRKFMSLPSTSVLLDLTPLV